MGRYPSLRLLVIRLAASGLFALAWPAQAGEVRVAVAANFAGPFQKIAADFAAATGHTAVPITGSTGKFYAQITSGAPFDVLLAADEKIPRQLEDEGLAVRGQRFTYARGRLVLWSARAGYVDGSGEVLRKGTFAHLALADPTLAPYGAAAVQTLKALGVYDAIAPRMVQGENITQTQQFIASGNAELGFLALSQVMVPGQPARGSWWVVPATLYDPIRQDAVLLKKGEGNVAASALLQYLRSDRARAVILSHGYEL